MKKYFLIILVIYGLTACSTVKPTSKFIEVEIIEEGGKQVITLPPHVFKQLACPKGVGGDVIQFLERGLLQSIIGFFIGQQ